MTTETKMTTKHILTALGLLLVAASNTAFSSSSPLEPSSSSPLAPLVEANKSRGFTTWLPVTDATSYSVEVYNKDRDGDLNLISTLSSEHNYIHMDPLLLTIPDIYFQIKALNNDRVMEVSDVNPNQMILGEAYDYDEMCRRTCDGKTVAWTMHSLARRHYTGQIDNNGNPVYTLGNKQLQLTTAYQYYDATSATYVPYWQAVSADVFGEMSTNPLHPYAQSTTGGYSLYARRSISDYLSPGVTFRDAQNNVVIDGWLIEKKLDQYDYMNMVWTYENADAGMDICSDAVSDDPVNGNIMPWVAFFNTYMNMDMINPPANVDQHFNNGVTPETIVCSPAWTNSHDTGVPDEGWNNWFTNLYESVAEFEAELANYGMSGTGENLPVPFTWNHVTNYINDFAAIVSEDGDHVTGIRINSITDSRVEIDYVNRDGRFVVANSSGDVSVGLYAITLYTSDGNAIPSVLEFTNKLAGAKQSEFAKLTIAPSSVENKVLIATAEATQNAKAQIFVYDLLGEQIYTEAITLERGKAHETRVSIENVAMPMRQLRVSLVFRDGSVLQQPALVVQ